LAAENGDKEKWIMRSLFITTILLLASACAQAGEAARIVFAAGDAHVGAKPAALGNAVQEGDEVTTGADGYVYLKTVDNGFLILRPSSHARIVAYHIDRDNPANTRVKLELLSGVARSISGEGVKQARQNFRFNTPVAAIGVRGTDFTVFTDQETSRVAVISGGIIVSGFSPTCGPEGNGPCEGKASRELFAYQVGQLLQVRKGTPAPQLLPLNGNSPDVTAPPRSDEPIGKSAGNSSVGAILAGADISLDPHKNADLIARITASMPQPVTPPPSTGTAGEPVVLPPKQIIWGRWQALVDSAANLDVVGAINNNKAQLLALNTYFAVLRSQGADWQIPATGNVGFALKQSEAYILDEPANKLSAAKVENGKLNVDFASAKFNTSFDLVSQQNQRYAFQAQGDVSRDGKLLGGNQLLQPNNMAVQGVMGPANGGEAAYIFQGRIDNQHVGTGVTYWTK
jgi:hypothetical protein